MSRLKTLKPPLRGTPPSARWRPGLRQTAAWLLRAASAGLDRLASRLSQPQAIQAVRLAEPPSDEVRAAVEFYAQAGAPEGALYQDGELLGYLPGVSRL